jgi:AcrR family transcriptional regulator
VSEGRTYGGLTAEQRKLERRARLEAACLEVVGTRGWAQTSVQGVCETAGVATRTLYEEHGTLPGLLQATYAGLLAAAFASVSAALETDPSDRIAAGLGAYIGWMTEDPRRARTCHREVRVSGVLDEQRRSGVVTFAALVARESGVTRLGSLALTGAVNECLVEWVADGCDTSEVPGMITELVGIFRRVIAA